MSITGKGDDACVKEKKAFFLTNGAKYSFSFRPCPSNQQHHFTVWCFGHHAYVFGSSPLSIGQYYAEIYKTHEWTVNKLLPDKTSKRKLTLMEARNTKCGHIHIWNKLMYFWQLKLGDSTISMYSGKKSSSTEWLLNPVNKGMYKLNIFVSYLFRWFSSKKISFYSKTLFLNFFFTIDIPFLLLNK